MSSFLEEKNSMVIDLSKSLQRALQVLTIVSWVSAVLFGLYILGFYLFSFLVGNYENWNLGTLPGLYDRNNTKSTFGMGLHFAAGGLILVLGAIQLIEPLRIKYPAWHRWIGRIYVLSCLATAIGGIGFILFKGTVGGVFMDVGFGIYGLLMFISAVLTWKYAAARNLVKHREWALRLFILAIGSWLYRIETGILRLFFENLGHTSNFQGPIDIVMDFFFYVPNLILLEIYLKGKVNITNSTLNILLISLVWGCSILIALATYYFLRYSWIPNLQYAIS
jgi:hypothetical protein